MTNADHERQLGKYTIVRELGRGGFATVYLAQDTVLRRAVALKVLHPALLTDPAFVSRFESEARAIAQFEHPHIATIYELGHYEGRLCIAMPLMAGGSLAERIQQRGPLAFDDAARVLSEVADALDHAHASGFIHRDVKPSNILFNTRGSAVLADFGLVKAAESSVIARTTLGGLLGTPAYMAPEVWEGKGDTPQTDVYALGCVLYEMLTGAVLFKGDTPPAVMLTHFQPRRYPNHWPGGTPPDIAQVLDRALAREPAERSVSAGALVAELRELGEQAARKPQEEPALRATPPHPTPPPKPAEGQREQPNRIAEAIAEPAPSPAARPVTEAPGTLPESPVKAAAGRIALAETPGTAPEVIQAPGQLKLNPRLIAALLPVSIALDIGGGELVKYFQLPLWLDSGGSILMGWLFGPWIGALAALLGRVAWWLSGQNDYALWFMPGVISAGTLAGFAGRLGLLRRVPPLWLSRVIGGVLGFGLVLLVLMYLNRTINEGGWPNMPDSSVLVAQNGLYLIAGTVLGVFFGSMLLSSVGYVGLAGLISGVLDPIVTLPASAYLFDTDPRTSLIGSLFGRHDVANPLDKLILFLLVFSILRLFHAKLAGLTR